jgi:hypothetical protein
MKKYQQLGSTWLVRVDALLQVMAVQYVGEEFLLCHPFRGKVALYRPNVRTSRSDFTFACRL